MPTSVVTFHLINMTWQTTAWDTRSVLASRAIRIQYYILLLIISFQTLTFPSCGRYHYHNYSGAQADAGYNNYLAQFFCDPTALEIFGIIQNKDFLFMARGNITSIQKKLYNDQSLCSDCIVMTLTSTELDDYGGVEVADEDSSTVQFRYWASTLTNQKKKLILLII